MNLLGGWGSGARGRRKNLRETISNLLVRKEGGYRGRLEAFREDWNCICPVEGGRGVHETTGETQGKVDVTLSKIERVGKW